MTTGKSRPNAKFAMKKRSETTQRSGESKDFLESFASASATTPTAIAVTPKHSVSAIGKAPGRA